jgi:acyl-CoA synthetase (AMP-forming)/AMP-acid ligase II
MAFLADHWRAEAAVDIIDQHRLTFMLGARPFLQELAAEVRRSSRKLESLRYFPTDSAPVPPEAVVSAADALPSCCIFRIYGSTEAPTVSSGALDPEHAHLRDTSEGFVVGHDVKLVSQAGEPLGRGEAGEITVRGPEVCVGYSDPAFNLEAFDADGYFDTGDLGRMTDEGALVIVGRFKDLIIRGGENISPKEVEDILHAQPEIEESGSRRHASPAFGRDRLRLCDTALGGRVYGFSYGSGAPSSRLGAAEVPRAPDDRGGFAAHCRWKSPEESAARAGRRNAGYGNSPRWC